MRVLSAVLLIAILTLPATAQNEDAGWTFYGRFQGNSSPSGVVLKADPSIGYAFNQQFETYVGLPVYFVDRSDSTSTVDGFVNGIGNAYLGFTGRVDSPAVRYSSNLLLTAPTGDQDRGFSTGRVTVDWTNTFSRDFERFTPFASIGLANTVSDTAFFVRPFSSHGLVTHFDGGTLVSLVPALSVGASVYAVRGSGEQRIVSRVRQQDSSHPVWLHGHSPDSSQSI